MPAISKWRRSMLDHLKAEAAKADAAATQAERCLAAMLEIQRRIQATAAYKSALAAGKSVEEAWKAGLAEAK
jgi:hypothetical protein